MRKRIGEFEDIDITDSCSIRVAIPFFRLVAAFIIVDGLAELFGGAPGTSAFSKDHEEKEKSATEKSYGRKTVLTSQQPQENNFWEPVTHASTSGGGLFNAVEDHDAAYERALARGKRRPFEPRNEHMAQTEISEPPSRCPAEDLVTDQNMEELRRRLEAEQLEWGQDEEENEDEEQEEGSRDRRAMDECPAARILAELGLTSDIYQNPISDLSPIEEVDTPASSSDWRGSIESRNGRMMGEPGPDLGGDDEVIQLDEQGRVVVHGGGRATAAEKSPPPPGKGESAEGPADGGRDADEAGDRDDDASHSSSHPLSGGGDAPPSTEASEMALLVRGAQVVNDDSVFSADVLVEDGKITQVSAGIDAPPGATVIEATGRLLLPAGIDVHTCFSAPDSVDDFKTGGQAAVAGGTATVIELVSPRDNETLTAAVNRVKKSIDTSACHVGFSVRVRRWDDGVRKEVETLSKQGINSFALDLDSDEKLYQALDACRSLGVHARLLPENRSVVGQLEQKMLNLGITGPEGFLQSRPEQLEKERVSTICLLSQITNCPVSILSLSSAESATALRDGRDQGAIAHPEVSAVSICSDGTNYFNKAPLCMFASGHKAHSSASRCGRDFVAMPKGVAGVAERLAVLWEKGVRGGRIDPMRFVALSSTNAAKVFNLYPQKGRIAVGADADLVLWDPIVKRRLSVADSHSKADTSPFEGLTVHGGASITIVGGRVAWKEGVCGEGGGAQPLVLPPNSPHLFAVVQMRERTCAFEKIERSDSDVMVSNGGGPKREASPYGDNQPPTARPRRGHNESSISFGHPADNTPAARTRNPPGGRTTGLW
ncbi:unnamed protein product, partial [Mesorhabditis spiculigera]